MEPVSNSYSETKYQEKQLFNYYFKRKSNRLLKKKADVIESLYKYTNSGKYRNALIGFCTAAYFYHLP